MKRPATLNKESTLTNVTRMVFENKSKSLGLNEQELLEHIKKELPLDHMESNVIELYDAMDGKLSQLKEFYQRLRYLIDEIDNLNLKR